MNIADLFRSLLVLESAKSLSVFLPLVHLHTFQVSHWPDVGMAVKTTPITFSFATDVPFDPCRQLWPFFHFFIFTQKKYHYLQDVVMGIYCLLRAVLQGTGFNSPGITTRFNAKSSQPVQHLALHPVGQGLLRPFMDPTNFRNWGDHKGSAVSGLGQNLAKKFPWQVTENRDCSEELLKPTKKTTTASLQQLLGYNSFCLSFAKQDCWNTSLLFVLKTEVTFYLKAYFLH